MTRKIGNKEYSTQGLYSVQQLSDLLDLSASTIYHHITAGHLKRCNYTLAKNRVYVNGSEIWTFLRRFYPEKIN